MGVKIVKITSTNFQPRAISIDEAYDWNKIFMIFHAVARNNLSILEDADIEYAKNLYNAMYNYEHSAGGKVSGS